MRTRIGLILIGMTIIWLPACGGAASEPLAATPTARVATLPAAESNAPPVATAATAYPGITDGYPANAQPTALSPVAKEVLMSEPSPVATPPGQPDPAAGGTIGRLLEAVAADFSSATGVPVTDVEVVSMEAMVWPDAGLSCPDPSLEYLQVTVEGLRITLRAGDQTADYHTEGITRYVRCEDGRPISGGVVPRRQP